ncbi:diguanylate cyclase (GGDEF)-like protein [Pararhizobium capsulatum DSM 1112]|uniref:diguanylate cyclase n=1 Tax=Pararhizobium capsulatum DSM 1112 TaxID=1121113 RepID=A0ABU0BR67_9HYPH|nr:GGDEF domain-containing protein [Pararhizobium capsulatum]MDQ0320447.1 diguanylate cyclase (GGDEF)-like protein [Pararhizobium capsulatum DSM 1112]
MNGALFLLVVNFLIAQLFCVFFLVIAGRSRFPAAGRWFAAAFATASLAAVFELLIRFDDFDRLWSLGAFASLLLGVYLIRVGIGSLYVFPVNIGGALLLFGISLGVNLLIYDLPRNSWIHSLGYQLPFFVVEMVSALAVYRSGRRGYGDRTLMALLLLTGLHFLSKSYFAVITAGPNAQAYLTSTYALVSQSLGAILVVSTGLTLLAVIVVDIMDEAKSRSEIDPLSGLLNRRGFFERVNRVIARPIAAFPHCVILVDLDHFKAVNDTYGHFSADQVIVKLAQTLMEHAPADGVCARLGGEEFAVFLPSTGDATGYLFAQAVRGNFSSDKLPGLPEHVRLTASFGVCAMKNAREPIDVILQAADKALYEAKKNGRNRVVRAERNESELTAYAARQARA